MHVVQAIRTGGLETLVLDTCVRMLRLQGVEVRLCALEPGDELQERVRYAGVPKTVLGSSRPMGRIESIAKLARVFRRERPHDVHLHNFLAHVWGGLAARLAAVPAIVTTKHGLAERRLLRSVRVAGWSWHLADVVVAVSADVRRELVATYGFSPERTRVILDGIDTERFRPAAGDREAERRRIS